MIGDKQRAPGQKRNHIAGNKQIVGAFFSKEQKYCPVRSAQEGQDDGTVGRGQHVVIDTDDRRKDQGYAGHEWQRAGVG